MAQSLEQGRSISRSLAHDGSEGWLAFQTDFSVSVDHSNSVRPVWAMDSINLRMSETFISLSLPFLDAQSAIMAAKPK